MQDTSEAETLGAVDGSGGRDGPPRVAVALVGMVAAVLGGWFGAPLLLPKASEAVRELRAAEERGGEAGGGGGHGEEPETDGAPEVEYMLPNVVLNPANSGGVRFLVATLALVATEEASAILADRDAEARDLVLTVLSARTVEDLSNVSLRDEIRAELRTELNGMLGFDGVVRIFFPQFVIQ